jgi:hypothetical protein
MTTTITTRVGKGGRLSFTEMDANFTNLKATADSAAVQSTTYLKSEVDSALATKQATLGFTPYNATNPSAYISSEGAPVQSVFGRTGTIVLASSDVTSALGFTPENIAKKDQANGYAGLDSTGKISTSSLPAIAITDTFVVASESAMLALTAQTGDVAVRTDLSESFILKGTSSATLTDWQQLLSPVSPVQSVNGVTGSVTLTSSNISEGSNLYFTTTRASAASPVQLVAGRTGNVVLTVSDVSGAAPLASPAFTGTVSGITATMVGLGNVDNTSDVSKPVSTAQQTALNLKANIASPTFTGTVSGTFSGNGAGLTNLTGANVTGTVPLANSAVTISGIYSGTITSSQVITGLGFTPYNATNPSSYITAAGAPVQSVAGRTGSVSLSVSDISGAAPLASPTFTGTVSGTFSGNGAGLTNLTGANVTGTVPLSTSAVTITGIYSSTITSTQVTTGLGFTPYNATNPSAYITSAGAPVQSVFGRTGAVVLASSDVTTALGFTPASSGSNTALTLVNGAFGSAALTTNATTVDQLVDSIAITAARSVKYLIQITSGSSYHATEMLIIHDGTTAYTSQSNDVFTGSILASFNATIVSGNLQLLVTPVNAASTIKVIRTSVTV